MVKMQNYLALPLSGIIERNKQELMGYSLQVFSIFVACAPVNIKLY